MASIRTHKQTFIGGEVSPDMQGRIDDAQYQNGLALCRNFIPRPQGAIENRPGFGFVRLAKINNSQVRLIPFTYSADQTMVVEVGVGYMRFHTQGATLLREDGAPYEITSPYAEGDLFEINFVQSADVMTLVHPKYAPHELRRLSATNWELKPLSLLPVINPPAAPTLTAAGHTAVKYNYEYVVTAIHADGSQSSASPKSSVGGNLFESGAKVTITWGTVAGAVRYRVYKYQGGMFGYIGQTTDLSLIDDNIAPDLSTTPPIYDDVFSTSGSIVSVSVTAGGANYLSNSGTIQSISILDGGRFIVSGDMPTVSILDAEGSGSGATASIVIDDLFSGVIGYWGPQYKKIVSVTLTDAGSGYKSPYVQFNLNGGSVQVSPSFKIVARPYGVKLKVTDEGGGSGASLEAAVVGGAITGVNVINGGDGYLNPIVTVEQAAGGSGALFGAPTVASSGDYPRAVSYFEQRRFFAGTLKKPQHVLATRSGTESDMSYSLPVRDDDRISFRVAARDASYIRHIVPLSQLLLLTASGEWKVSSADGGVISPSSLSVSPMSYIGASTVPPVVVNNTLIFAAARGGHMREMAYNWQAGGFQSGDLSLRAAHLFDGQTIVDMAYAKAPVPIVWAVSNSGKLLGFTYVPEQQIGGWHQHDTDGVFESCCTVSEGNEDKLYVVVRRPFKFGFVNSYRRCIERLSSRAFTTIQDAFFVDSGVTYRGEPVTTIMGLGHLRGKEVSILADGAVHRSKIVPLVGTPSVTLDQPASVVHIGLPYKAQAQTLPLAAALQDGSFAQGHTKNVNKVWLKVLRSSAIEAGADVDSLTLIKPRSTEPLGTPPALKTEELSLVLSPKWAQGGQVMIQQSKPLPLSVLSITAEVSLGG